MSCDGRVKGNGTIHCHISDVSAESCALGTATEDQIENRGQMKQRDE